MPTATNIDGHMSVSQRVNRAIASASDRTGIDFDYLLNQARIESDLNPAARAKTSSAVGLFQFTRQTWLGTVKEHGASHGLEWAANAITKRDDGTYFVSDQSLRASIFNLREQPEAASAMAAEFAADNGEHLSARLGRTPEPVDLYIAHFLGAGGAVQFLSAYDADPDAPAAPMLPKAAAANRSIFYNKNGEPRSFGEIRQRFATKLNAGGANTVQWADNAGPVGRSQSWHSQSGSAAATQMPSMRGFEPMPTHLSLRFAHQAYQRLASLGGGTST